MPAGLSSARGEVNDAYQVSGVNLCSVTPSVNRASGHHHGDLRNALEQAALVLVSERGPRGFTLAEASRRAGVSVAAPYKHYADRDALLASLALRGYREQRQRFATAVAATADPAGQLAAFAMAYVTFAAEERSLFEITFAAGLDKARYPELAEAGNAVLAVLTAPARLLCNDPEDALELVLAVAASAHGLAVFLLEGVFGALPDALPHTRQRAAAVARTLAQQSSGALSR
jgi:AcrR family transcriptional regulator